MEGVDDNGWNKGLEQGHFGVDVAETRKRCSKARYLKSTA